MSRARVYRISEATAALLFPANRTEFGKGRDDWGDATPRDMENALERIEKAISGEPGDPGKLYALDERVRRVIAALKGQRP